MVQTDEESSKILWCGNLHEKVTEELLYELFLQAGPLQKVKIVTHMVPSGARYAFVTFKHSSSVSYTLNLMNGIRLFDKPLRLQARNSANSGTSSSPASPIVSIRPNLMIPSPSPAALMPLIRYPVPQFSSSPGVMLPPVGIRPPLPVGFPDPGFGPGHFGIRQHGTNIGFHRSYSFPESNHHGDDRRAHRTDSPSGDHKSAPYGRPSSSRHHDSYRGTPEHGRHEGDYGGQRSHYHRDRHHQQQHTGQDFRHSDRSSNSRRYN